MKPVTTEHLLQQIERAIRAGQVITVGEMTIRYCKRGQEFTDDAGNHFQALASGVFLRMDVFEGRDLSRPTGTTWGHIASIDELDQVLKREIEPMNLIDRDGLSVDLAFTSAMRAMRGKEAQQCTASTRDSEIDFDPLPTL
jgi:hypothetical protein